MKNKKLKYRVAIKFESDHFIEAENPEEAVRLWQEELQISHIPYVIKEQEWIKGGFRLVVELKKHLNPKEQNQIRESISINNVTRSGELLTKGSEMDSS